MLTPLERATKPNQYDFDDILWADEGHAQSTRTQFFWEYLEPYARSWRGKSILDIGAGTGWLVDRALEYGAIKAVGIEPSEVNIAQGKKEHPNADLVNAVFERYDNQGQQFDEIIGVMSFSHIVDIDGAFSKTRSLLKDNSEVILIVPDFDYFKTPRHDYSIEMQPIDEESYAVAITRPSGILADVVRKTSRYQQAAESVGIGLIKEIQMKPTEYQIANEPKYASMREVAIARLLIFKVTAPLQEH